MRRAGTGGFTRDAPPIHAAIALRLHPRAREGAAWPEPPSRSERPNVGGGRRMHVQPGKGGLAASSSEHMPGGHPASIERTVLNRLRDGIAVLDASGTVMFCNAALTAMADGDCGLRLRGGRLRAISPTDNSRLESAIAACIGGDGQRRSPSAVPVAGADRAHAIVVSVLPILRDAEPDRYASRPAVLVVAVDTAPAVGFDTRFLRDAFQLSDAEAGVAVRLLAGATLSEIAAARGISLHTARTQLKSILAKTGMSRQSDLVNLLSRCDTVTRSPGVPL